jgi:hypothetical protein
LESWSCKGTSYRADQDPQYGEKLKYMYAPDVVQGNDGRFYLYYCMSGEKGVGGYGQQISVAVCDTPDGNYEYYGCVRNPDGSPMLKFVTFDPALINDNGTIRLYYGTWYPFHERGKLLDPIFHKVESNMFGKSVEEIQSDPDGVMGANHVELADDMLTIQSQPIHVMPSRVKGTSFEKHPFFEGSSIRKLGSTYYFIYSSIKGKDMLDLLKNNKALQCFIFAATSDKLAMNIAGQSVITTLLYGIIIGNVRIGAIMNMVAIFPALIFSVFGGKYTGKHGSAKGVAFWSQVSIYVNLAFVIVLLFAGTTPIVASAPLLILFIVLTMLQNGLKVVDSTATTSMLADVVDYEAYRSGRYMPGVVAGVYSLVDKVVSSLGAVIATFCISLIGYTATIPQPTDPKTMPVVIMGILVVYVLPVLGWICTLIAMKKTPISKEKMVEIQKTIGERKKNAEQIDA